MTQGLRIQLLGGFSITGDGEELIGGHGSRRLMLLLAYLLLKRNRRIPREQVAYLFWKDSTEKQARSNLRGLLTALRQQAPALALCLFDDDACLGWRGAPSQVIDVEAFEAALERATRLDQADQTDGVIDALQQAIALYTGELLPAFYEDWVLAERLRLEKAYLDALFWLTELLEKTNRPQQAIRYAEQLWQADPLRETSIALLMRLCAAVGDRARALSVYASCTRLLRNELGVEPGPAIQELHSHLLLGSQPTTGTSVDETRDDPPTRPPIGRAAQWEQLVQSWRAASAGAAQIALLSGEAGIGKSYLARELSHWCRAQGALVLSTTCPQARTPLPYVALSTLLATPQLAPRLERMDDADMACLQMLSPTLRRRYAGRLIGRQPPQWQELRLQQALTMLLSDPAEPTLLILDDAQWCDEQSLEWLHYLFATEPTARVLVLMLVDESDFRDLPLQRARAALLARGRLQQIELQRLSVEDTACLAQQVTARPLDERTIARLYTASAGNPFFVVELVRMLNRAQDSAHTMLEEGALPASVLALVMRRLSTLSQPARQLLDVAAVVGLHFTLALLCQVEHTSQEALIQALDELWRSALIVEAGSGAYSFGHDLVRQVIYRQLSDARRRHLHQRVAEALIELAASELSDVLADEGDLIAGRLALAGRADQAAHVHAAFLQNRPGAAAFSQRWA